MKLDKAEHEKRMIEQSKKIEEEYQKKLQAERGSKLTPRQQEAYDIIGRFPDITKKQIRMLMGVGRSAVDDHISILQLKGMITATSGVRGALSFRQKSKKKN